MHSQAGLSPAPNSYGPLRFVCEAEMEGRAGDLNEYVEVLGRPKGYSPAEDSSVRTRAYKLRQKLQKL